ncbi:MAG: adenosylmethionine decarboxylase [Burkholderiaceae bacterium]|nr:adenosylmethionine decarboxylase [Burkholderiaceae bacterium]
MQGLHLTADLYGCRCEPSLLTDAARLAEVCRTAVRKAELTLVDEKFFTFPDYRGEPGGVTGAVLLAESHVAVHTWPERAGVTLDVYVCNFSTDNSSKAEQLLDDLIVAFAPRQQNTNRILRGSEDPDSAEGELLLEWLNADSAFGFRAARRLETVRTPYQTLEVFDTPQWGRLFRLDGCYMTSERDEFFYHEAITHPAALAHPNPTSALVIGGGDGGSTEELLKHPSMRRVVLAELDAEVIRVAREHLQNVHRGAFDDPRVELRIGDGWESAEALASEAETLAHGAETLAHGAETLAHGAETLAHGAETLAHGARRFDLVVLDLTDPDTPAHRLYTADFFRLLRRLMNPGAAVTLHIGSPLYRPDLVARLLRELASVFAIVRPLGLYIPLYGAYWGLCCASDALDPLSLDPETAERRLAERGIGDLRYYNGDTHQGLFALPNFYRELLPGKTDVKSATVVELARAS